MNTSDVYNKVSYAIFDILRNLTTQKRLERNALNGIIHDVRFRFLVK